MKISHIVTNGCSFTYCQGLPNLITQGWPALLANKFQSNLVNLALPGVGNDNIHRRTYEYVYQNMNSECKPLFIIAWSQPWRREAWFKNKNKFVRDYHDYAIVSLPDDLPENLHERALLENWNEEEFIRKTLLCKLSLINLFENHGIPYLMTDYASHTTDEVMEKSMLEKFPQMYRALENKAKLKNFYDIVRDYPKLPCGHDGEEAQTILAEYLHQSISEIYPNLSFDNTAPYLRLKDFIKGHKYPEIFPEWCKFKLN